LEPANCFSGFFNINYRDNFWYGNHSSKNYYSAILNFPEKSKTQVTLSAKPVSISIPAISVNAPVVNLGLNKDRTLALPKNAGDVGWYEKSVSPGQAGASVLVGHLDWWTGKKAIFYNLKKLKAGDEILITKDDGSLVTFKVDSLTLYSQNAFPTNEVYGKIDYPGLRLITCAGKFNVFTQRYSQNLVVFATLK